MLIFITTSSSCMAVVQEYTKSKVKDRLFIIIIAAFKINIISKFNIDPF
jgi:hypothetical protein